MTAIDKIIPKGERTTEQEAFQALVNFLQTQAYGEASFTKIFSELPRWIQLTKDDWTPARARSAEKQWHAQVRNIGAHYDLAGNQVYRDLLVKRRGGGFQLRARIKKEVARQESAAGD